MNVLVISPHPDDEAIGCGGTISHHVENKDSVHVVFLTSGEKGGHGQNEELTKNIREAEARDAASILKISSIDFWHQPDGKFNASAENINRLLRAIETIQAQIIYAPHIREQHPDHREAALMVLQFAHNMNSKGLTFWFYEVWTPLQYLDNIVDISMYTDTKRKAIQAHKSQCNVLRFDDAILGLNRYRGEMHSWPGGDYAEVFSNIEHQVLNT